MTNKNIGRPVKVNFQTINKLEDAFRNGVSVTKACRYAGISRETYYRYQNDNEVFAERMKEAKSTRRLKVTLGLF